MTEYMPLLPCFLSLPRSRCVKNPINIKSCNAVSSFVTFRYSTGTLLSRNKQGVRGQEVRSEGFSSFVVSAAHGSYIKKRNPAADGETSGGLLMMSFSKNIYKLVRSASPDRVVHVKTSTVKRWKMGMVEARKFGSVLLVVRISRTENLNAHLYNNLAHHHNLFAVVE